MKSLIVTKIVQKVNFEGNWEELEAKAVSRDNHRKNIRDKLYFSCQIAQYRKTLISNFQQFSASINNILSLEGRLSTML